jgi:hypothetical protein
MKLHHLPTLCAALLVLSAGPAAAQTTAVPNFISYQGTVVNAEGTKVGTGTPVNRTVIFRIWNNPSSTAIDNLIYSEAQVVTISDGEFSVLVGQGVANTTTTFGYNEAAKFTNFAGAFDGSARYLGVTVAAAAAIVSGDNEITPRQQIVSTPFAMRARFAESIGSSSDLTLTPLSGTASNYGLGWYGTGRLFGTTAVDGPVLYGNAGGALGSNASGTQKIALNWDASGRVGIGAPSISSATNKLTLQGDMATTPADQLTIRGNTDNNKRLLFGYDTTNNKATLQSYTAAATTGQLLLNPSGGNVGINKVDPSVALDVAGEIKASGTLTAATVSSGKLTLQGDMATTPADQITIRGNADSNKRLLLGYDTTNNKASLQSYTAAATTGPLLLNPSGGNVGIGVTLPAFPLTLSNTLGDKIALNINTLTNLCYGLGVQNSLFQIHTDQSTSDIAFGYGSSAAMTETMRIKGNGAVSIPGAGSLVVGTTISAGTTITANGKSVPVTDENNLKIVRGIVRADGTVALGSGFTATKVAGQTGLYQITFTTTFQQPPVVTTNIAGRYGVHAHVYAAGRTTHHPNNTPDNASPSGFTAGVLDASANLAYDFPFQFIAIGPR